MTCLGPEQLAELATIGGDHPHLAACVPCRAALADQVAIRALGARLAVPTLPRARRDALAAEVMAHADMLVTPRDRIGGIHARDGIGVGDDGIGARVGIGGGNVGIGARVGGDGNDGIGARVGGDGIAAHNDGIAARSRRADTIDTELLVAPGVRAVRRAAGGLVAFASAAAIALATAPGLTVSAGPVDVATAEALGMTVRGAAADDPAPPVSALAAVDGTAAELTRAVAADRDVIALRGGSVILDSRATRDVDVTARDTVVHVDQAKARVVARAGAIESVAVFAGSVEVTTHGKRQVIEAGAVWVAEASHGLAPPDPGRTAALRPFLDGWTALRAGDNAAAIAAFDRATDPVVAEDAAYWAAVAADRAGDHAGAARRFADFVDRFAASPRAEAARAALDQLR